MKYFFEVTLLKSLNSRNRVQNLQGNACKVLFLLFSSRDEKNKIALYAWRMSALIFFGNMNVLTYSSNSVYRDTENILLIFRRKFKLLCQKTFFFHKEIVI